MATEQDFRQAISRIKSVWNFTRSDLELAQRAASQAGSLGNDARAALRDTKTELGRFRDTAGSKGNFARDMLPRL